MQNTNGGSPQTARTGDPPVQLTAPQPRTAADLFAHARAAEHAATLAFQQGAVQRANWLQRAASLRHRMALSQASLECRLCEGYGLVANRWPAGCNEHDEPGRTGRHWERCPNVVAHPPATPCEKSTEDGHCAHRTACASAQESPERSVWERIYD
ncbi:hypothetical protein ACFWP3_09595 [Streptomyces sp. NPDC058525]|uniref:hypothetical protein n=1 Tax=Streptomyces sp. NPDC058525 TaxID=3346538 RepID=UPI00365A79A4